MRRWLIRNSFNKILGPISKSLILDLMNRGLLKDNDEVASGNGHWFYLWEKDLVNRYILGDEEQDFNPVSSTKSVLINTETNDEIVAKTVVLTIHPVEEQQKKLDQDVERFTAMEVSQNTQIGQDDEVKYPDEDDLAFPDVLTINEEEKIKAPEKILELDIKPSYTTRSATNIANGGLDIRAISKSGTAAGSKKNPSSPANKKDKDDRFLFFFLYGLVIALIAILIKFVRIIVR
jgi:hypothetical protein